MDNNREPDETDTLWSVDSYQEMEYRIHSLRSLVCDLLKTNQELRDALTDAHGNAESRDHGTHRGDLEQELDGGQFCLFQSPNRRGSDSRKR